MQKGISKLLLASLPLLVCGAAISYRPEKIVPFECEQVKGKIRIVLLKVERATLFQHDYVRDAKPGKVYPIPFFGVTYLVEALGDEPIKSWHSQNAGDGNTIEGKRIDDDSRFPENLVPAGYSATRKLANFGDGVVRTPSVTNKKRVTVKEDFTCASKVPGGRVRLKITAGINGHPETFVFNDVPLD